MQHAGSSSAIGASCKDNGKIKKKKNVLEEEQIALGGLERQRTSVRGTLPVLGSIVVSIPACHAGDPGSIPGREALFTRQQGRP